MKKKEIVIIDLREDKNFKLYNSNYIKINCGNLKYNKDCKEISLNINKIFKKKRTKIIKFFKKVLYSMQNFGFKLNLIETEIFNLRHDKSNYIERILILEYLYKYFLSKKLIRKVITDDFYFANLIRKNFPNLTVEFLENKSSKIYIYPFLSLVNYFFKLFMIVTLFKINNKIKLINKGVHNFTSYPHFFRNQKCKVYNNSYLNLNFLLGDETQSNFNIRELIIKQREINNIKNLFPIEKKITYYDLVRVFIKNINEYLKLNNFLKKNIYFEKFEISLILKKQLVLTFINRLKLSYYDNAIKKILDNRKVDQINYYMFEYSFGFYLSNILRSISKKIITIGYQHGIFTKNLLWIDLIEKKYQFNYLPNIIISNQKISRIAYAKYLKKNKIYFHQSKTQEIFKFKKLSSNNSKNILFILGLHDFKDNIETAIKLFKKNKFKNFKFFLKFHPKTKKISLAQMPDNFKIIKKIPNNDKFQIFISQSSSLLYKLLEAKVTCNKLDYNYKFNIL